MPAGDSRRKNNTCLGFEVWSLELLIKKIFYFFIYIISYRRKSIKKLIDRYRFLYLIFEFQGPMFCGRKTKLAWVLYSGKQQNFISYDTYLYDINSRFSFIVLRL